MATIDSRIKNILGRSFNDLKQRHINFISDTEEFKDFNFEGSRLNVLMSALTYSTYYMQSYANFTLRESFLKTCKRLSSAIIAAQDIGYVPRGPRGASTTLSVTLTDEQQRTFYTVPRGTLFSATILDEDFVFTSTSARSSERLFDGTYRFDIPVVQGELVTRFRRVNETQREFVIRDRRADTSTVNVYVNGVRWQFADTSISTRPSTQVWYLRWSEDQFPIIYFGTGDVSNGNESGLGGLRPSDGADIEIEYVRTDKEAANGASSFSMLSSFDYIEPVSVIDSGEDEANYSGASGGSSFETLQSIRTNADVFRSAQQRCVTAEDYESVITRQFGNFISSIRVTGSSNNPGFAFINIKPTVGLVTSPAIRSDIENYVSGLNVFTVTPRVTDPTYMFIIHDIDVDYDVTLSSGDEGAVRQNIIEGITEYYQDEVESFGRSFHSSRLLSAVDNSDNSVFGSSADIQVVRELVDNGIIEVFRGSFFGNAVERGTFTSSEWTFISNELDVSNQPIEYSVYLKSKDNGDITVGPFTSDEDIPADIYETDADGNWYMIGSIDYISSNYVFSFPSLGIDRSRFRAGQYSLEMTPVNSDVYADQGVIIAYDYQLRPQYTQLSLTPVVPRR